MPNFPLSLTQQFRKNKLVVGAGFRAYFAPYNYAIGSAVANSVFGPTILDLTQGPFNISTPSSLAALGFQDLGWIKDFKRTPESKIGQVRSGYRGAVRAQYRGQVGETAEWKFREYGRMQYKLASGTNVINLMAASGLSGGTTGPLSASGAPFAVVSAYNAGVAPYGQGGVGVAPTLTLTQANGATIAQIGVGSDIVCDQDYVVGTYGLEGDSGTPVYQNAVTDIDYIRKNSDYVAQVSAINGAVLTLTYPFVGGGSGSPAPLGPGQPGYKVQAIKGWAAREGGTFISEWSGLLVLNTVDVCQVAIYYPHLSIMSNKDMVGSWTIENAGTTDLAGAELDAQFAALAFDDPEDGETVVSYIAYYVRPGEQPQI
jgi:hypothetical protein